jgi:hypothetical protein
MLPSWYTLTAGPVPEGIVNLTELIELDLSFNRLSGTFLSLSLFTQTATYSRTIPLYRILPQALFPTGSST